MTVPAGDLPATIKSVALFSTLTEKQLEFVRARLVERRFQAGEIIFNEGDSCLGLYIVHQGTVRLFKTSAAGREQTLAVEARGSAIAELPVFDGGLYPASAQAMTDSVLLFLSKQDFRSMCLHDPELALKVLAAVGARLRHLVGIIEELSFTTIRHRLAALLLRLAKTESRRTLEGVQFTLPPTNQDIAAQIGTVRELVSRNLSRLQAEGLLKLDGRTAVIPSVEKFEAELTENE